MSAWTVKLNDSAQRDLRTFSRPVARRLWNSAVQRLKADPTAWSRHLKPLRPNGVASFELRLFGKYRILFEIDEQTREVQIECIGEKVRCLLFVQGKPFVEHGDWSAAQRGQPAQSQRPAVR